MWFHRLINSVQAHNMGLLYFYLGLIIMLIRKCEEAANYLHLEGNILLFGMCRSLKF